MADRYLCWCDGDSDCEGVADEPFGLCDECKRFGHQALPAGGLRPDDMRVGGIRATAEGRMRYSRSGPERADCVCCDGRHVYSYRLTVVGGEAYSEPGPCGSYPADMREWLYRQYRTIPDGAIVRVTVEVVDA